MSQTDCLQVPELLRAEPEIEIGKRRTIENNNISKNGTASRSGSTLPKSLLIHVLTIQVIACVFSNGVFPSIQSYSCLPYGNVAYHFVATLSTMANPAVCLLLFVIPPPTKKSITTAFSLAILVSAYVLTTAIESPRPPLQGQAIGEVLLVGSWVLLVSFFTYVKVSVATILRSDGKRGLFWCGAITQFGSATGAIVTFFIVNYTTIFESYNACQSI
jgi:riboflavin transporter 2